MNAVDKPVRVEHVIEALKQTKVANDRLLILFRAMDPNMVLAVSGDPSPVQLMTTPTGGVVPRIEPMPILKDNC